MSEAVVVHVKLIDEEPFRLLARGVAEAAEMLTSLTEAERDSLPDAALLGIARLRAAVAEFTGEQAAAFEDTAEDAPPYRGTVIIEWPASVDTSPYACMVGHAITITDAVTGKLILTCTSSDVTVHADANSLVTANLTLFADADGEPILDGMPVPDGDGILTGTFPFLVAEMRVRGNGK